MGACDDGPGTQYLPIGSACSSSGQCGTTPFDCKATYPGGYCEKPCTIDANCPTDSLCAGTVCRRKCGALADCRSAAGYECRSEGLTTSVCESTSAPVVMFDSGGTVIDLGTGN